MIWQQIPYTSSFITTIIVSIGAIIIILYTSRSKKFWRIRFFIVLGSLFWVVAKYMELGFVDREIKLLLSKIQFLSYFFVPAAILIFSLYYSGREKWVNKGGLLLLSGMPLVASIMILTNDYHGLIIKDAQVLVSESFLVLQKDFGIWYWIIVSYSVLLILFGVILMNKKNRSSGNKFQWQSSIAILVLLIFPLAIGVLDLLGYDPYPNIESIIYTVVLGSMVTSTIMYRKKDEEVADIDNSNIVDSMKDGIILLNMRDNILFINKTFQRFFDRDYSEMVGKNLGIVFPDLNEKLKAIENGSPEGGELKIYGEKEERIFDISVSGLFSWQKILLGKTIVIRDMTSQKIAENNLVKSEKKFRLLFENSVDGIYRGDLEGDKFDLNTSFAGILGYGNRSAVNNKCIQRFLDIFKKNLALGITENTGLEAQFTTINGKKIWLEMAFSSERDQFGGIVYTLIVRDITSRKKVEEKIRYLSFHDGITKLYNRSFFETEIKRLDVERQLPLSIIIADIDGLKVINDNFGHKKGDILLQKIAAVLRECFRSEDIIARYGGDEFAVILPSTTIDEVPKIFQRIRSICLKGSTPEMPLSISVGAACKVEKSQDINSIIKEADSQMYKNKLLRKKNRDSSRISFPENAPGKKDLEPVDIPDR